MTTHQTQREWIRARDSSRNRHRAGLKHSYTLSYINNSIAAGFKESQNASLQYKIAPPSGRCHEKCQKENNSPLLGVLLGENVPPDLLYFLFVLILLGQSCCCYGLGMLENMRFGIQYHFKEICEESHSAFENRRIMSSVALGGAFSKEKITRFRLEFEFEGHRYLPGRGSLTKALL